MPFKKKYHYPVRQSNAFELLIDGEQYFTAMLTSINNAQHFILLEQYLVATGSIGKQFIHALTAAVQRGVRVFCLLDDYGSRGLNQYSRQQLKNAGIHLSFYNPIKLKNWQSALFRDHRKLLLIDNSVAYVGGAGITDDFISDNDSTGWHDVLLKIEGEVLTDWFHSFATIWQQASDTELVAATSAAMPANIKQTGQVLVNSPWHQEFNRMLLNKMRQATQYIWLTTPYFVPSWKLRRRLRYMARRGVDVRLLLPDEHSDHPWVTQAARRYYTRLLKQGVRIFEYKPRFIHAKLILCDQWLGIGSSNLDRWNQHWNLDANQSVDDASLSEAARRFFQHDFEQSHEINLTDWLQRSWWQRWRESYAGYLILLLERLSRYFPRRRKAT